ncbi:hypothetical protein [Actinoplanes sp. NPDC051851]|uniref:hypothetical protein n=1 Tax=Actinoplanes sp. NPDC051851 TaxID=3154753 RepID=UPI0034187B48
MPAPLQQPGRAAPPWMNFQPSPVMRTLAQPPAVNVAAAAAMTRSIGAAAKARAKQPVMDPKTAKQLAQLRAAAKFDTQRAGQENKLMFQERRDYFATPNGHRLARREYDEKLVSENYRDQWTRNALVSQKALTLATQAANMTSVRKPQAPKQTLIQALLGLGPSLTPAQQQGQAPAR